MFQMQMAMVPGEVDVETLMSTFPEWFPVEDRIEAHRKLDLLIDFHEQETARRAREETVSVLKVDDIDGQPFVRVMSLREDLGCYLRFVASGALALARRLL